ncbi:MAG: hypothetical protein HN467_17735, partial [Opitutae bacterium]|nr:hypothetical protein [Opitutae bacterium]
MPEFEENKDAAKNAPYTYEPSQSSAAELGELAGVVETGGKSGDNPPTKSRWGKSPENSTQENVDMTVPAGEIDLSNKDTLKDAIIENTPSNRASGRSRDQGTSRKDRPQHQSTEERQDRKHRSGQSDRRGEGRERSDDNREHRGDTSRSGHRE